MSTILLLGLGLGLAAWCVAMVQGAWIREDAHLAQQLYRDYSLVEDGLDMSDFCEVAKTWIDAEVYDRIQEATDAPPVRVLCVIMTYKGRHDAAKVVARTWGARCAGFLAVSDEKDDSVPTVQASYQGPEGWSYLWVKKVSLYHDVRQFWEDMGWGDAYDYVFFGDDDTYVVVPNLLAYLAALPVLVSASSEENEMGGESVYIGSVHRIRGDSNDDEYDVTYNVGGAGSVFNARALRALCVSILTDTCTAGVTGSDTGVFTFEDVFTGRCMAGAMPHPIVPKDTRDEHGRHRFFCISPLDILSNGEHTGQPQQWVQWYQSTMVGYISGSRSVSPELISFHDIKDPKSMLNIHRYLTLCPSSSMENHARDASVGGSRETSAGDSRASAQPSNFAAMASEQVAARAAQMAAHNQEQTSLSSDHSSEEDL